MNFTSYAFLVLLLAVIAVRLTLGRTKKEPVYFGTLIVASLTFYGWHVPAHLSILMLSVLIDYYVGRSLKHTESPSKRKRLLILSLLTNFGLLGFFKYTNFALFAVEGALHSAGLKTDLWRLDVLLPMGISFYTFQSVSYTIDVYRRKLEPVQGLAPFLLYVSFFPQLVAGPIVRARDFLYQLPRKRTLNRYALTEGLYLTVRGFFLKMVVADNLGWIVDQYWSSASGQAGEAKTVALLTIFFAAQIFADFAGYSSIARGISYFLGFRLPLNFNSPYIASSFSEFWTRWHITLSQWLRDYLYIPLGGNRLSNRRTYLNLMIVMLLGGLWHGASFNFVVWGFLHGLALVVERFFGLHRRAGSVYPLLVQAVVFITWIFFRSVDLSEALGLIGNLAVWKALWMDPELAALGAGLCLPILGIHLRRYLIENKRALERSAVEKAFLTGVMLWFTLTFYGRSNAFIYFQF